jgi:predicted molibdopterin-dependent oxidoreductase YjgC
MSTPSQSAREEVVCGAGRRRLLHVTFDRLPLPAHKGETIAAALLAAGRRVFRLTGRRGEPRGLFCGMGLCFDCLVQVDGCPNVRACQTTVAEGMRVETQRGAGCWQELS